ncbi:MAG: hypothetical protein ACREDZ_08185 [Kiloniellales bacterium]
MLGILLALTIVVLPARAQETWQPILQPPAEGEFWRKGDSIALLLPEDLPVEVLQRLALELDSFDVTSFVRREGALAILDPPQPLEGGIHNLRLVEYGADGSIIERGAWIFEVRRTESLEKLEARANLDGAVFARIADKDVDGVDRVTGQSAGEGSLVLGEGGWESNTTANYFYNSQKQQSLTGHQLDLGEYRVTNSYRNDTISSQLNLGHHDIGAQNFIMNGFYRRGVSARIGPASERLSVTGFALRSESLVGVRDISGIEEARHRVQGAHMRLRPIESLAGNLEITGTAYDGTGDSLGFGSTGISEESSGRGGDVAIDTRWFDDRLRLRGEFALSDFDFDGDDQGFGPEMDQAYGLLASYSIFNGEEVEGQFVTWDIGLQHEKVGSYFASLANPFVVHDRVTTSGYTNLVWGEYALQVQGGYQANNVEDFAGLPTDNIISLFASGTYTPTIEPEPDGSLPWIGQPILGLTVNYVDVDQTDLPAVFIGEEGNNQTRGVTGMVGSSYETWGWTLTQGFTSFEATATSANDSWNSFTDLSGYFTLGERVSVSPYSQWNFLKEQGIGSTSSLALGISTSVDIVPEVLTSSLNYNVNLAAGATDQADSHYLGGELLWAFLPAEINRPGLAMSLSGSFQDSSGVSFSTAPDRIYQVFLGLKVNMPAAY